MNAQTKIINIAYPIEAVKMKYLTNDQALVFGALKANGVLTRQELALIGITPAKQAKVLGTLVALERIRVEGDLVIYIPNATTAEQAEQPESQLQPEQEETVEVVEAEVVQSDLNATVQEEDSVANYPKSYKDIEVILNKLIGDKNYTKLYSGSTDIEASAKKIFDYYNNKGWKIGNHMIKSVDGIVRRAVSDKSDNPWGLVNKSLSALAKEADTIRAHRQQYIESHGVELEPWASIDGLRNQALASVVVDDGVDRAPWQRAPKNDELERENILLGLVTKQLGPRPTQLMYSNDSGYCNASGLAEWKQACKVYDSELKKQLELAKRKYEHVETSRLKDTFI